MIAACPKCEARYRVEEDKVGPEGARLRCARCQAVFRVRLPVAAPASEAAAPVARPAARSGVATAPQPRVEEPAPKLDPERLVLVADPREDSGKQTASALAGWGLHPLLVHDGVEALMTLQRMLPRVVILDAALPKMYGFQICEVVKRNDSLKHIKVILVGAIHNRDRYRRPPSDLYGADVYLEQPDLPEGLAPLLVQYGMPLAGEARGLQPAARRAAPAPAAAAQRPAPAPSAPASPRPAAAHSPVPPAPARSAARPQAPAAVVVDAGLSEEREKAERLARIVVSDIILYQGEKFEQAIRAGNLLEALDGAIEEGRNFFRQRIPEAIRNEKDHLVEELMRVARERGMK